MPIYEFHCLGCGHEFEELVRSSEDAQDLLCPQCNRKGIKKKISTFAAPVIGGGKVSTWTNSSRSCNTGST
jgi:putative FmdB family regulatory protein